MKKYEAPIIGELFAGLPSVSQKPPVKIYCTLENYRASCHERWHGVPLLNALDDWEDYQEHRATFTAWCEHYKRDPQMFVGQKAHNPEGTLSSMVWVMQTAIEPDQSRLHPCLDFEEHFQTVFIRRGLLIYLTLLLKELEG